MSADPTTFPRSSIAPSSDNDNVDASPGSSNKSNGSNSPVLNRVKWKKILRMQSSDEDRSDGSNDYQPEREKWSFGVLNDKETDEVPGKLLDPCRVRKVAST